MTCLAVVPQHAAPSGRTFFQEGSAAWHQRHCVSSGRPTLCSCHLQRHTAAFA